MLRDNKVLLRSKSLHHVTNVSLCVFCVIFLGELTANAPSTARVTPKQGSAAVTLPQPTATTTGSQTAGQPVTAQSSSHSKTTTQQVITTSITKTQEAVSTSSKTTNQPNKTAQLGRNTASTTLQSSRTGKKGRLCSD